MSNFSLEVVERMKRTSMILFAAIIIVSVRSGTIPPTSLQSKGAIGVPYGFDEPLNRIYYKMNNLRDFSPPQRCWRIRDIKGG